ncbi:hypothetical protein CIB48_g5315 [Xylaria polymorpha]|nr:hypothetical protein CIB48_g5315 [Xylaria polymorpha]
MNPTHFRYDCQLSSYTTVDGIGRRQPGYGPLSRGAQVKIDKRLMVNSMRSAHNNAQCICFDTARDPGGGRGLVPGLVEDRLQIGSSAQRSNLGAEPS